MLSYVTKKDIEEVDKRRQELSNEVRSRTQNVATANTPITASEQRRTVNVHALGAGGAEVELPSEKERQEMKEARKQKNEETKQQNSKAADDVRRAAGLGLSLSEYYTAQEKDYTAVEEQETRVASQQKQLLELQAEYEANPYEESVVDQYNSLFEIYKRESASLTTAIDAYNQKYFGELEQEEPEKKSFIDRLAEATAKIGAGTSGDPRTAEAEAAFGYMPEHSATEKNRVENVLGAGGKGYQANTAETLGFLMSEEANEQETAADVMFGAPGLTDVDHEPQFIKDLKAKISEKAYAYSDKMNSEAEEHTIMAKDGVGTLGSMLVDAGIAGTQMAMDMGVAALTHTSALVPMAVRSFGGGATEARQAGADWEQQFAYGVGSAAVEVLTEKIGNVALPFGKMYGAGALDDLIKAGIERTASGNAGRLALTMLFTGVSEGGEELISSLVNPLLKKMTYDPDALQEFGTKEYWSETLEEFIVGAMLGGIGGSVEIASDFVNSRATGAEFRGYGDEVIQAVIDTGLESDPKTLSYQLAKEAKQKLDAGKTLSDREIGNMYYANVRAIAMEQAGEEPEDTGAPLDLLDTEEVQKKEAPVPSQMEETGEEILTERYQDQIDLEEITPEEIRELGAEYDAGATMAEIDQRVHEIVTAEQKEDAPAIESETNEVSPVQGPYGSESTAGSANTESVAWADEDVNVKVGKAIQRLIEQGKTGFSEVVQKIQNEFDFSGEQAEQYAEAYLEHTSGEKTFGINAEGNFYAVKPEEHIDQREMKSVGKRTMPSFQYQHPELHQYFVEAAEDMLADLRNSEKGTRGATEFDHYSANDHAAETGGYKFWGSRRHTTKEISYLLDQQNLSYADVEKALSAMIQDKGQENYAAAKRVELVLDDMLTYGHTSLDGYAIPANEEYIEAKNKIAGAEKNNRQIVTLDETEVHNENEGALFDGGRGREADRRTGGQTGILSKKPKQKGNQSRTAVERQNRVAELNTEYVSAKALGIGTGTDNLVLSVYPESEWDDELRRIQSQNKVAGLDTVFLVGGIQIGTNGDYGTANGVFSDGTVYVRVDHTRYSAEEIAKHERYHSYVQNNAGLNYDIMQHLQSEGGERLQRVYQDYFRRCESVYDFSEMDEDEIVSSVFEEIAADAYAEMRGSNALEYADGVRKIVERYVTETDAEIESAENDAPPVRENAATASVGNKGPTRYSYVGEKAKGTDLEALERAKQMQEQGIASEMVRKKTGWFQGLDGKWRFEIDDSGMEFRKDGDAGFLKEEGYQRLQELTDKWSKSFEEGGQTLTQAEENEMEDLGKQYSELLREPKYKLTDFLKHDELLRAYPRLRGVSLVFDELPEGTKGGFSKRSNTIVLSNTLFGKDADVLLHELQHVIQSYEGFAHGSSPEYWRQRIEDGYSKRFESGEEMMPSELYQNTAGEIEARDVTARRTLSAEERKKTPPDLGDENTVFANYTDEAKDYIPGDISQQDVQRGIEEVAGMEPVASITGEEFKKSAVDLVTQVEQFFDRHGNMAFNPQLGDVILDRRGAKSDISHGIGRKKAAAFAAVPEIIENGRVIDFQKGWKGRAYDTAVIAAPISISEEPYLAGVVLIRDETKNRFYVHEVLTIKDGASPFKTGVTSEGGVTGGDTPSILNLLQKVQSVKDENAQPKYSLDTVEDESEAELENATQKAMEEMQRRNEERLNALIDDPEAYEQRLAEERAARLQNIPKADFTATPAMETLGIKVEGSIGRYGNTEQLKQWDRSAKQIREDRKRAEKRLNLTDEEKEIARQIANGVLSEEDIPRLMNPSDIMELADHYSLERATDSNAIKRQRNLVTQQANEKAAADFAHSEQYNPLPNKGLTKLIMNERTPERIMRSIFGQEKGAQIYNDYFWTVETNEAERFRFLNRTLDEVRRFKDKTGKERVLTREERALAQKVKEGRAVAEAVASMEMSEAIQSAAEQIRETQEFKDAEQAESKKEHRQAEEALVSVLSNVAERLNLTAEQAKDARYYARWIETQQELEAADATIIENAVKKYDELYNTLYEAINDFLLAHGYDPIPFRSGYAPHMQSEKSMSSLMSALKSLGVNTEDVSSLPASIAGRTADFKPNMKWNPYFQSRTGDFTVYDIQAGFESYLTYISDVFYHTDDIMRLRAVSRYLRKTYSPEIIRSDIEWAEGLRDMRKQQKENFLVEKGKLPNAPGITVQEVNNALEEYIAEQYEQISNVTAYGEFVSWLDNYINIQAGKQSLSDRGLEYSGGRTFLNVGSRLMRMFSRTNVGGNLSSVLNQTAQAPMIAAELGTKYTIKAIGDIVTGQVRKAAFVERSDFLTGKDGIKWITKDGGEKFIEALFAPASFMDMMVSEVAVRGAYLKALANGATEANAMKQADAFGRRVMGSRMKGTKPIGFESKTFVSQMLHIFQVEVSNTFDHVISDMPSEIQEVYRAKGKGAAVARVAASLVGYLLSAFLLNRIGEEVYGGTPIPFDIFGITANFFASGYGLPTNEYMVTIIDNAAEKITGERLFGTDMLREEFDFEAGASDSLGNAANDIPYLSNVAGLLGIGDQSLPTVGFNEMLKNVLYAYQDLKGADGKLGGGDARTGEVLEDLLYALVQVLPGGRQIKKTYQGGKTMINEGYTTGSGDTKKLQYPVEGSLYNWISALLFGRSGLRETEAFYAGDDNGLTAKQTAAYYTLRADGMTINEIMAVDAKWNELQADEEMTAKDKATEFAYWVDTQGLDEDNTSLIKDTWTFSTGFTVKADTYEKYVDAGLSNQDAQQITEALGQLQPEAGYETVRPLQKLIAIAELPISENAKDKAIRDLYGDSEKAYSKYRAAIDAGAVTVDYADLMEAIDRIDENGSLSQAEFQQAVLESGFPTAAAKALWYAQGWKKTSPWG